MGESRMVEPQWMSGDDEEYEECKECGYGHNVIEACYVPDDEDNDVWEDK